MFSLALSCFQFRCWTARGSSSILAGLWFAAGGEKHLYPGSGTWDPGHPGLALQRWWWKGAPAEPYLPVSGWTSLLIYSRHFTCSSPVAEGVHRAAKMKGLAKPLQPLLPSSHGSKVFNASSYISEETKPQTWDNLDLKFDSDLSPFTNICFNL